MVIPVGATMHQYPAGPPPEDIARKLRPLGWCMVFILLLSLARALLGDTIQGIVGDMVVILAVVMLLRDDAVFGQAGTSLMQCTQGFCGQGGLTCLMPVAFISTIDMFFDGLKVYGYWSLYSSACLSQHSSSSFAADGGSMQSGQRFLSSDEHAKHASFGHVSTTTFGHVSTTSEDAFSDASTVGTTSEPTLMPNASTVEAAVSAACSLKLPALLIILLLRVIVAMVMVCLACRVLQTVQAMMIRDLDEFDDYAGGIGGAGGGRGAGGFGRPGGFGGFGGHGFQPDGPAETFHGHGRILASEEAALQQALAASAADAQGGGRSEDAALQQALAASAAEANAGGGNTGEENDAALQEALRQSREEELARRERAAAAAEARAQRR